VSSTIAPAELDEQPLGRTELATTEVTRSRFWRRLLVLTLIWTTVGAIRGLMRLAIFRDSDWGTLRTMAQGTLIAWCWIPVSLGILALVDRFPWGDDSASRRRVALAHLGFGAVVLLFDPLWTLVAIRWLFGPQPSGYLDYLVGRSDTIVMMYLAVFGAGYAIATYRRYADRQAETVRLESELADAQLYILTMQLQPHFLFNTLHLVSELVHDNVEAARRMLHNLARLLKQSFEHASRRQVTLAGELAFLESYLDIQRSRFEGRLTTRVDVPDDLRRACVPHLLLQPLVENAIRHGIARHAGAGRVTVSAVRDGDRLVLRVRDDGAGLPPVRAREGMGISNTRLRLHHLYRDDFRFEVGAAPGATRGAEALIDIPFAIDDDAAATEDVVSGNGAHAPRRTPAPGGIELPDESTLAGALADDSAQWPSAVAPASDPAATPPEGIPVATFDVVEESSVARTRVVAAARWLAVWICIALVWTEISALSEMSQRTPGYSWLDQLWANLSNVAVWVVLTPVAIWLARRFRLSGENLGQRLTIHLAGALAVTAVHMFAFDRIAAASGHPEMSPMKAIIGWGVWDVAAYFTIVAFTHLGDFAAWYRERAVEGARLRAEVARARVQLLRLQLQPRLLLSSLEALSALAATDPERCDRMITRLGDLLRSMLARAGRPTSAREELAFADALRELERAVLVDVR
jgi:two-component system LytT family sensor kinase